MRQRPKTNQPPINIRISSPGKIPIHRSNLKTSLSNSSLYKPLPNLQIKFVLNSRSEIEELEKKSKLGDIQSTLQLAREYEYGILVEQNLPQSLNYYKLASKQQNIEALVGLIRLIRRNSLQKEIIELKNIVKQGNGEMAFVFAMALPSLGKVQIECFEFIKLAVQKNFTFLFRLHL